MALEGFKGLLLASRSLLGHCVGVLMSTTSR
jgi:hypothetical protein